LVLLWVSTYRQIEAKEAEFKKKDEKEGSKKEIEKKEQEEKKVEEKKDEEKKDEEKKEENKKDDADAKKKFEEDPDAKLEVSPMELLWEFEQGQHNIKISNNSKVRFAVKVRCTDIDLYTVSPVTEFVDVGKSINIAVVRAKGPLKKDKIVLCSKQVPADEPDAAEAFKTGVPHVDVIMMDRRIRV
ncbi:MSP domain protein, partial [Ancylostoma caninum]